jgi:hypothetical protein
VKTRLPEVQQALMRGEITAVRAAESLLAAHEAAHPAATGADSKKHYDQQN